MILNRQRAKVVEKIHNRQRDEVAERGTEKGDRNKVVRRSKENGDGRRWWEAMRGDGRRWEGDVG